MTDYNYSFNAYNKYSSNLITQALLTLIPENVTPIFICIGSDLVLGDSLGPLCGTLLKERGIATYVYGTLSFPVTAKEIKHAKTYLKELHPDTITVAIDAAIGSPDDVGLIRVIKGGLKPGLGVDKKLGLIGDVSMVGVVAGKSVQNYNLFNLTRLNLVYKMAENIVEGIMGFSKARNLVDNITSLNAPS